ncbi:MAG: YhcH/YjgK/YiaL family protein [Anaerorhabdus sp.]|uniref:YhcH/YjgK/YiaL family protein n=1 Tax=Anaerorhabdus sp. TaxID=1872524 RepID=UPI003A89072A
MIYDKIENLENYEGRNKNLDTVIQYIKAHNYSELPTGKTLIKDDVFVNVFEYEIEENQFPPFEFHELFGDVHLVVTNQEIINSTQRENVKITTPYDIDSDAGLGNAEKFESCLLDQNHFYVAFPEDAHRVKVYAGERKIKKIVFKFKIV